MSSAKRDRHTPPISKRSETGPNVIAPRASMRESLQILAIGDDGVDVSGRSDGRPFRSYMAFQFVKLVKGFRRKKLALRQAASPALMTAQFCRT